MDLKPGSRGAFEVRVGGRLVHSKLASGDWPDTERVLEAIAEATAGRKRG